MRKVAKKVAGFTGFSPDKVVSICRKAPYSYKRYTVSKESGGERVIYQPSRKTKSIQYALVEMLLKDLEVSKLAWAYRRGISSPLKKMARMHAGYSYSVRVDFKDFFYSIQPKALAHALAFNKESISDRDMDFVKMALFASIKKGRTKGMRLAIGAPSSPSVSNAVLFELDQAMERQAKSIDPESTITRYADDIVFSTDGQGTCDEFVAGLKKKLLPKFKLLDLSVNDSKTAFMSRGTKRMIGGLIICPDGSVSVGRKRKRYVKKLLNDFRYDDLGPKKKEELRGLLAFISDVEPGYLNNLAMKYTAKLVSAAQAS